MFAGIIKALAWILTQNKHPVNQIPNHFLLMLHQGMITIPTGIRGSYSCLAKGRKSDVFTTLYSYNGIVLMKTATIASVTETSINKRDMMAQ